MGLYSWEVLLEAALKDREPLLERGDQTRAPGKIASLGGAAEFLANNRNFRLANRAAHPCQGMSMAPNRRFVGGSHGAGAR